ncbi:PQQ-binding-like beta-propeller repeat protein [Catenuloplanes japonicus]|uniref:PQQ-binding-like beta-propeller repeat protein n=1 Tax=Catenuloplanes japonicus TaxID=33876 RepID=UPI00052453B5|nr:PQQ-binding-like beta-propeller repeat protein [Catenuloplanes japonicus]
MVTIDLGVMSGEPPEPVSRGIPPGTRRAVAVALCVALAGGLLTGSARAGEGALPGVRVPAAEVDPFFPAGDRLYVAGPATLTAFAVPGGERLWQQPVPPRFQVVWVEAGSGDTLLAMLQNWDNTQHALALDRDTGETRWSRQAGWPMVTEGEVTVFGRSGDGTGKPIAWEAVRTATGERLWRREFPAEAYWTPFPDDPGRVLVMLPGDQAQVWDLVENRMLSSAQASSQAGVSIDGDRALVLWPTIDRVNVTAYALPGLERLWAREYEGGLRLGACGPEVLCAGTDLEDRVLALDPDTGEALWESAEYSWLTRAGPLLLADGPVRTAGVGAFDRGDVSLLAADIRTGRTIRDLGRWRVIGSRTPQAAANPVVVARFALAPAPATIAEVDQATMTVRVLAQVRAVAGQCYAEHDALFCRLQDGAIGMWDLSAVR